MWDAAPPHVIVQQQQEASEHVIQIRAWALNYGAQYVFQTNTRTRQHSSSAYISYYFLHVGHVRVHTSYPHIHVYRSLLVRRLPCICCSLPGMSASFFVGPGVVTANTHTRVYLVATAG